MAVDIFLKLADIKGEFVAKDHKDEINVLSWSWASTRPAPGTRLPAVAPARFQCRT